MNKKIDNNIAIGIIVVVLVVVAVAYFANSGGSYGVYTNTNTNIPTPTGLTSTPSPYSGKTAVSNSTYNITIGNFNFSKNSITIKRGDTIVWTNTDPVNHTVTGKGGLNSGAIAQNGTYSFTFNTTGAFTYQDHYYPAMTGIVYVTE